jgi:PIN domain nuclease of toxin-antitoxin system
VDGVEEMIVLDTHALIWVLEGAPILGRRAAALANRALAADRLWTSAVVFWELSLLIQRNRVRMSVKPEEFRARVLGLGIQEAVLSGDIAIAAARLSGSVKDPADCFIAATALVHDAKVMTADARLLETGVVHVIDARR